MHKPREKAAVLKCSAEVALLETFIAASAGDWGDLFAVIFVV